MITALAAGRGQCEQKKIRPMGVFSFVFRYTASMKRIMLALLVIILSAGIYLFTLSASNDRTWESFSARTPDAIVTDNQVTLTNVRNWNHSTSSVLSEDWIDTVEIEPQEIKQIWFGLSSFSPVAAFGHTFLSFELIDGSVYTLSIEARREADEEYSFTKGLLRQYDLLYGWGTERDYVGVRAFLLDQQVELYPLTLTPEESAAIFAALAEETHRVASTPRFYNTLTSNCTNELVKVINHKYPDSLPYHISHNLPGLSIDHLQNQGLIEPDAQRIIIPANNQALLDTIDSSPEDFSRVLRDIIQTQNTST